MWFPYYFSKRGFVQEAPYLSSILTLLFPLGVYLFDIFYSKCHFAALPISFTMQFINLISHLGLCFVPHFADYVPVYAVAFAIAGISYGGPYGCHTAMEMKARAGSSRELYLLLSVSFFLYEFLAFL